MASHRISNDQLGHLINYMENHTMFARGQVTQLGKSGSEKYHNMWKEVADALNGLEGANKNAKEWETTWKNLKNNAKKRKADYFNKLSETGNVGDIPLLSEFDIHITDIFGDYGVGLNVIEENGLPTNRKDITTLTSIYKEQIFHSFKTKKTTMSFNHLNSTDYDSCQRNRPNGNQLNLLLSFMEKYPPLAKGDVTLDDNVTTLQWDEIASHLNNIGKQARSVNEWKKTWTDKVRMVKDKKNDYVKNRKVKPFTQFENKVLIAVGEKPVSAALPLGPSLSKPSSSLSTLSSTFPTYSSFEPEELESFDDDSTTQTSSTIDPEQLSSTVYQKQRSPLTNLCNLTSKPSVPLQRKRSLPNPSDVVQAKKVHQENYSPTTIVKEQNQLLRDQNKLLRQQNDILQQLASDFNSSMRTQNSTIDNRLTELNLQLGEMIAIFKDHVRKSNGTIETEDFENNDDTDYKNDYYENESQNFNDSESEYPIEYLEN